MPKFQQHYTFDKNGGAKTRLGVGGFTPLVNSLFQFEVKTDEKYAKVDLGESQLRLYKSPKIVRV